MSRLPRKPNIPSTPNIPSPGGPVPIPYPNTAGLSRQEKASKLKAEMEAAKQAQTQSGGAGGSTDRRSHSRQPAGEGEKEVVEGDCISSIAKQTGHFWETLWNDPSNAELKEARKDPNILLPKDKVTVRPITQKWEPGETEMRHRFVRRGEPSFLPLTIMDDDKPMANKKYKLIVGNKTYEGNTDSEGKIDVPIPGNAKKARLIVGEEDQDDCCEWDLDLGHVDPVETDEGVKKRLTNLGFEPPKKSGGSSQETQKEELIKQYQKTYDLNETGRPDTDTQDSLKEKHGS